MTNMDLGGLFHKILRIRKLRICSNGQILPVSLHVNCQNFVIYNHFAVNYEEKVLWNRPLQKTETVSLE